MQKTARYSPWQVGVIVVSVLLLLFGRNIPGPAGLSASGMQVLGVLVGGLLLWLFVGVDWPSMMALLAMMLVPELGVVKVTAGSLGNSTVFFLVLCFMLSASLAHTGVARRLAVWFMTSSFSRKGPWYTMGMIFVAIFVLSSGLSSTSTLMVFLPILYAIFEVLGYKREDKSKFAGLMITSLVVISQIAQSTTPISHAMTLIGMSTYTSYTGNTIDFSQYVAICLPVGILAAILWFVFCRFVVRPDVSRLQGLDFEAIKGDLGPITKPEKIAGGIYLLTILLWVLPGVSKYAFPALYPIFSAIDQNYPPLVGILILHFIKVGGKPVMTYQDASKAVPWNTAIFMGTLLMLGSAVSNPDIGLSKWVAEALAPAVQGISPTVFVIFMVALAVIATNVMSNAVTIAVTCAIALPLCATIFAGQINEALITILITCGANFAFATPPATPPVAVAMDSGWVGSKDIFIWGMSIALIGLLLICTVGIAIGGVLFG